MQYFLERVCSSEDTHEEGAPSEKRALTEGKSFARLLQFTV